MNVNSIIFSVFFKRYVMLETKNGHGSKFGSLQILQRVDLALGKKSNDETISKDSLLYIPLVSRVRLKQKFIASK